MTVVLITASGQSTRREHTRILVTECRFIRLSVVVLSLFIKTQVDYLRA